ncbi:MAG TPA: flavin prenyltransferase UbiX [Desulfobacteraceae bacterium]|nr:flavin prenyltransferase UbiX [Desulfobacteraceae bacterium]
MKKKYVVALCGASGSIYGIRLIKALVEASCQVMVVISDAGFEVLAHETEFQKSMGFREFLTSMGVACSDNSRLEVYRQDDGAAPPASGSFVHSGMVVAPCSMKTLADISTGSAGNLVTRSADVTLKERRPLILLPRETPLSLIHLENMTRACRAGAVIMPPSPSFYSFPRTMDQLADTVVARVLDHLGVHHTLVRRWGQ